MTIPRRVFRALAIGWTVLILVGTLMPQNPLMREVGEGTGMFRVPGFDKIVHFALFAGFVFFWWLAVESPRARLALILGGAVLLGILTELGQAIPMLGRDAGLDDLAADLAGIGVAAVGLGWLTRRGWLARTT